MRRKLLFCDNFCRYYYKLSLYTFSDVDLWLCFAVVGVTIAFSIEIIPLYWYCVVFIYLWSKLFRLENGDRCYVERKLETARKTPENRGKTTRHSPVRLNREPAMALWVFTSLFELCFPRYDFTYTITTSIMVRAKLLSAGGKHPTIERFTRVKQAVYVPGNFSV